VVVHLSTYIIFSTEKFVALVALPLSTPLHLLNGLERLQHVEASRKRAGLVKGKPDLVALDYCSCIHEQDNTHMSRTQRLPSNPVRSNTANQASLTCYIKCRWQARGGVFVLTGPEEFLET
jgi:hypothetical protein